MDDETFLKEIEPKLGPVLRRTNWKPSLQQWMENEGRTSWYKQHFREGIEWLEAQRLPKEFPEQKAGQNKSARTDRARAIAQELDRPRNPWYGVWYGGACKLDGSAVRVVPKGIGRIYDPIGESVHIEFLNHVATRVDEAGFPKVVADFADHYGMMFSGDFEPIDLWRIAARYLSFYDFFFRQLRELTPGQSRNLLQNTEIMAGLNNFDDALASIRIVNSFKPEHGKSYWAWIADSLWAYMCLGLYLHHCQRDIDVWRHLDFCANPKCPTPYFERKRRNAKHCSTKCARETANLRYEQTERRKEKKRKYNRDYYKKRRAREKTE